MMRMTAVGVVAGLVVGVGVGAWAGAGKGKPGVRPSPSPSTSTSTSTSTKPSTSTSTSTSTKPKPKPREKWGGLRVALRVPAWDAVMVGGIVVVVDADFRSASGWGADGKLKWRTKLQDTARGRQTLRAFGGAALWWGGSKVFRLEPASGKLLGQEDALWNGDCGWDEVAGACSMSCQCHFQLAACDSGKLLGKLYQLEYMEEWDEDGTPSSGCWGGRGELLARSKSVAVVNVDRDRDRSSGKQVLGLDLATGAELWRTASSDGDYSPTRSGSLPGGQCYLGTLGGRLEVLDCATGKLLWKRAAPTGLARLARHLVLPHAGGLYRFIEGEATLHDPATGKVRWRVRPQQPWAAPLDAVLESYLISEDSAFELGLLDAGGKLVARIPFGPHESAYPDPGGGRYVTGPDLVAYDASGRERARTRAEPENPVAGLDFVGLFSGQRLRLLRRSDLAELADLPGSWGVTSQGRLADGVLLHHYGAADDKPGEAVLVLPPAPTR